MDATIQSHIENLHREAPALYLPYSGWLFGSEKRMEVYGNQQHVGRFTKLMEAWMNLGEPKYTDYHVELICPAAADDTSSHSYLDKRPNATLRFSLNEV